jgi:hypothetical protein
MYANLLSEKITDIVAADTKSGSHDSRLNDPQIPYIRKKFIYYRSDKFRANKISLPTSKSFVYDGFVMHNLELATTFYRQSSSIHKLREKQRIKKCDDTKFMSQKKINNVDEIFVLQAIL